MLLKYDNVENLVFNNNTIAAKLSESAKAYINTWKLGQRIPTLRPMGQKAKIDFLRNLSDEDKLVISKLLREEITIQKLDYTIIENHTIRISDSEDYFSKLGEILAKDVFISRDSDHLYISIWK